MKEIISFFVFIIDFFQENYIIKGKFICYVVFMGLEVVFMELIVYKLKYYTSKKYSIEITDPLSHKLKPENRREVVAFIKCEPFSSFFG